MLVDGALEDSVSLLPMPKTRLRELRQINRRAVIEDEFGQLISKAEPREGVREAAVAMFRDAWDLHAPKCR
jgi:hypothetical protein